jgi:Family of unknown function (DUF6116)
VNPLGLGPGALVRRFASRLRFPTLFWLTLGLFLFDLVIPDVVPFIDEILLALLSLLFASWKKGRTETVADGEPEMKDVTPRPPAPRS